jgi:hypothetical protein
MDGLMLLRRARDAGLKVEAAGDKLMVRGPKRAEAVVKLLAQHKAEVLAVLSPAPIDARRWYERFTTRAFEWLLGDREAAKRLAWGDLENDWHHRHGKHWPSSQCAGCDMPMSGCEALNLPDGNRVHFEPIDCLIRFGRRWRGEARAALIALGLEPSYLDGD